MASPFNTPAPAAHLRRASDASIGYLRALMTEKAESTGTDMVTASVNIDMWLENNASQRAVSANIDRLKAEGFTGRGKREVAEAPRTALSYGDVYFDIVPAGRYAIETEDGATNGLAFYKVDRPTEGKWAGRLFVKLMVSDDEQRLSQKAGYGVVARIAKLGAEAAAARYGQEIGECGMCGRTLTNDESRARGIGPVCAAKAGW